jgi:hypothetical protein
MANEPVPTPLEKLEKLSDKVRQEPDKARRHRLRAQRGGLRSEAGYAIAGLVDCLMAYLEVTEGKPDELLNDFERAPKGGKTVELEALTGEALRVYVRDVLLSRSRPLSEVRARLDLSLQCFIRAENALGSAPDRRLASWLRAHAGSVRALLFWIDKDATVFDDADKDFKAAVELLPNYKWAVRFRAFLHTIRGDQGDFQLANTFLRSLESQNPAEVPSNIYRSEAMLQSFLAAGPVGDGGLEQQTKAARAGIAASMAAASGDTEEFHAPYFGAACRFWLALNASSEEERNMHLAELVPQLDAAEVRTKNTVSQAIAMLVGLYRLRAMRAAAVGDEDPQKHWIKVTETAALWQRFPPDLETLLIMERDPVWRALATRDECKDFARFTDDQSNYASLRESYARSK